LEESASGDGDDDAEKKSVSDIEKDWGIADWTAAAWIVEDEYEASSGNNERMGYSSCIRTSEDDNYLPILRSFRAEENQNEPVAFRHRATKDLRTEDGPNRNFKNPGVIEGFIRIGEIKAHVLLDCGSTLDMISANYAATSKLDMFQLKKPVRLQMATSGSRTTINFGVRAEIRLGDFKQRRYFDVVNLDRYDAILGLPFLKENEVMMNFSSNGSFRVNRRWFQVGSKELKHSSFKEGEGTETSSKQTKGLYKKRPE
jgi:Retroviral aspartyl protease